MEPNSHHVQVQQSKQLLTTKLTQYRPRRIQRYKSVNVLILLWEDLEPEDAIISAQASDIKALFSEQFNYAIHTYEIPSQDSQSRLNLFVAQFVHCYGREDNLIIVYYGGHGYQPSKDDKSTYLWAATAKGGSPTVDWSLIQPQFMGAGCDVALFLDCCHAGQAARGQSPYSIELLAATVHDSWTPKGNRNWSSFTAVLIEQLGRMLDEDSRVSIFNLHRQMVRLTGDKKPLVKQPLYVCLSAASAPGTIQLSRLTAASPQDHNSSVGTTCGPGSYSDETSLQVLSLRLRLFKPLDLENAQSLLKWATRDSPSMLQDVEVVEHVIDQAKAASNLGQNLIRSDDGDDGRDNTKSGSLLPFLSQEGKARALQLLADLKESMRAPATTSSIGDLEAMQLISNLKERSNALVSFIDDCVASLNLETLGTWRHRLNRDTNKDLRDKITMRLTLLQENLASKESDLAIRVQFDDKPAPKQHLRLGKRQGTPVLVEYIYYDASDPLSSSRIREQVARISALQGEPKSVDFCCHHSIGFVHEDLHGPRFGIVYALPSIGGGSDDARQLSPPTQLSKVIGGKAKLVPLEVRYKLAEALCGALLSLHSVGWFHKAIRSDNVVLYTLNGIQDSEAKKTEERPCYDFSKPYLINFDCSRPEHAETYATVDFDSASNIYRHPERWGRSMRYERHHDLYSLGLLLLEIGSWKLLPSMDSEQKDFRTVSDPEKLRGFLLNKICVKLRHVTGSQFAEAVGFCLSRDRDRKREESWKFQEEGVRTLRIVSLGKVLTAQSRAISGMALSGSGGLSATKSSSPKLSRKQALSARTRGLFPSTQWARLCRWAACASGRHIN
ncbi:hypothetical protein QBC40DRAFT_297790 [Triangularia verruculosa]|uniref:Protein kinase domain-containing protein n=1 Tax=Triangularia verruculosa TaxID=2587418 RepID=A0AAN6XH35_9PEZI|nr:hypothetical protein QBC40DRAFT_297790 [Triangularia verruculosa]